MPAITSTAPGKIILFGEHAVVYGRPAIAAPVTGVKARAIVIANPKGVSGDLRIHAPDIDLEGDIKNLAPDHQFVFLINVVLQELEIEINPTCTIRVTSTIPVSSGLGSGTAVSVAVIRALSGFLGKPLSNDRVSAIAFEVDKLHHGNPSGIDNAVITQSQPIYYSGEKDINPLRVARPIYLLIGDTGIPSHTGIAVADLRNAWQSDPEKYESIFDAVGAVVQSAKDELAFGQIERLGTLMDDNQRLLDQMGVSSPELENLLNYSKILRSDGSETIRRGKGWKYDRIGRPEFDSKGI